MKQIEREWKFIVTRCPAEITVPGRRIEQAYLSKGELTIRARVYGDKGFLTIKSHREVLKGAGERLEFEYEIPASEASELIGLCKTSIIKTRHVFPDGLELDIFKGDFEGLVIAELEQVEGSEPNPPPGVEWINVSLDPDYTNRSMCSFGLPDGAILATRTPGAKF